MPDRDGPLEAAVRDWNNVLLGHVESTVRDGRTRALRGLVVALGAEARDRLGRDSLLIPVHFVYGLRSGEVTLDRSLDALRHLRPHEGAGRGPGGAA